MGQFTKQLHKIFSPSLTSSNSLSLEFIVLFSLPKPLIPVDGRPLISHWLELALAAGLKPSDFYIITNEHFHKQFASWAEQNNIPSENAINDGSTSNDNRLGACRDIQFALENRSELVDDLMVIGGDTLFFDDFKLTDILDKFHERGTNVILWYPIKNDIDTLKTGVLELSPDGLVTAMLEKPDPSTTLSRCGCPCFYLYKKTTLPLVLDFIKQAKTLGEADAPGHFLSWYGVDHHVMLIMFQEDLILVDYRLILIVKMK